MGRGSRSTRFGLSGTGSLCSAAGSRSISSRSGIWISCAARSAETPPPDNGAAQPILPELPVKVLIKQFGVQETLAWGAGRRRRGSSQHCRQGDARAAVRGPRPDADRAAPRRAGRLQDAPDLHSRDRQAHAQREFLRACGGIFAHLANLPGLPPVKLAFNGAGALDNFIAKLDFNAGADVWANGQVIVARQGAGRR